MRTFPGDGSYEVGGRRHQLWSERSAALDRQPPLHSPRGEGECEPAHAAFVRLTAEEIEAVAWVQRVLLEKCRGRGGRAMNDNELVRVTVGVALDRPFLWTRDKKGVLVRQIGNVVLKVFPKPPEGLEQWGSHFLFNIRRGGRTLYRSRCCYGSEREAIRACLQYALALFKRPDGEDEEPLYDE